MPVSWEQLQTLKGGAQWTIATAREYVSFQDKDPWEDYWKANQTLAAAMPALGVPTKLSKRLTPARSQTRLPDQRRIDRGDAMARKVFGFGPISLGGG